MFLGVLIYSVHSTNKKPFKLFGTNLESFKAFAMDLKFGKYPNLSCIPAGIVDNVRLMLHYKPDTRPNLYELLKVMVPICIQSVSSLLGTVITIFSVTFGE